MAERKNYSGDGRSAEDRALDKFAELMIEKLQTIQSDWKKPWFTQGVSTSLPKNLNGREYNGMNSLMLMMHAEKQSYELPVWCTFDRVIGLNYTKDKQGAKQELKDEKGEPLPRVCVNKGEKSFPVFITVFSVVDKDTKEKIKYDDYKHMQDEEREKYNVYPKLQVYNVFNVAQTNIREARPDLYQKLLDQNKEVKPEVKEGEMFSFPAVDRMISENKWVCPIKPIYGDDAYYSISKKEIVVPQKEQFKSGESFYSNLAHEMAHSTGVEELLNRLKPSSFGSKEYAREELVAELSAALVSQRYGMGKTIKEDSVPYLKNWLDSLKEEPSFIKTVLQDVKKASGMINQHIDKVQLEIDGGVKEEQVHTVSEDNKPKEIFTADIPKWALPYLENGDASGLSDKEQQMVDDFVSNNLSGKCFSMDIDWDSERELNVSPAFGERNPNALPNHGESPYQAVDTVSVRFMELPTRSETREQTAEVKPKEEVAAKMAPRPVKEEEPAYHFHR